LKGKESFDFSKIFLRLWNPKIHYRIHKLVQKVHTQSQMNPIQTLAFRFLKVNLELFSHPYQLVGSSYSYVMYVSCFSRICLLFNIWIFLYIVGLIWIANLSGRTSKVYIHSFYLLVRLRGGTQLVVDIKFRAI